MARWMELQLSLWLKLPLASSFLILQLSTATFVLAQSESQLRSALQFDAQLQALQQAWDSHDIGRTRKLLEALANTPQNKERRCFPWCFYNREANSVEVIRDVNRWIQAVLPDSSSGKFYSLGQDSVEVWDTASKQKVARLQAKLHDHGSVSADGRFIALSSHYWSSEDKTVEVFDLSTHQSVANYPRADQAIFSPNSALLAVATKELIELRSSANWQVTRTLSGHTQPITFMHFSGDGMHLAASGMDKTVHVWRVADGQEILKLQCDFPDDVLFIDNPARLIVAERGRGLRVWDLATGGELHPFQSQTQVGGGGGLVLITHDQKFLATVIPYAGLGWIDVWELATGKHLGKIELGDARFDACLIGTTNRMAVATDKGVVEVWNLDTVTKESSTTVELDKNIHVGRGLSSALDGTVFWCAENTVSVLRYGSDSQPATDSPSTETKGATIKDSMVWINNGTVEVGDISNGAVKQLTVTAPQALLYPCMSANGKTIVGCTSSPRGQVTVWRDGRQDQLDIQLQLKPVSSPLHVKLERLAISASGRYMAAWGRNIPLQCWDLETNSLLVVFEEATFRELYALAVSDQQQVATVFPLDQQSRALDVWKVGTKQPQRFWTTGGLPAARFSHDGQWLISVRYDLCTVWNLADGKQLAEYKVLPSSDYMNPQALILPDKQQMLRDNGHGALDLVETLTGKTIRRFTKDYWTDESWNLAPAPGQRSNMWKSEYLAIRALAISGDATSVAAQFGDGRICQWNLEDGRGMQFAEYPRPVSMLGLDRDGQTLILGESELLQKKSTDKDWQVLASFVGPQPVHFLDRSNERVVSASMLPNAPGTGFGTNESGLWSLCQSSIESGELISRVRIEPSVLRMALSPDHQTVAVATYDRSNEPKICLCDMHDGQVTATLSWRHNPLRFTPDGQQLIGAVFGDHPLVMPDTPLRQEFASNDIACIGMARQNSPKLLALGYPSGEVQIWNYEQGQLLKVIPGHSGTVRALEFSPEGNYVASAGDDRMIRFWSITTGLQVWSHSVPDGAQQLQFDSQGHNLALLTGKNKFLVLRGKP